MQTKINTLKSLLPSSPFVTEQIGYALKYAQESNVAEEELKLVLDQAIYLTEISNKFSSPNLYAYRPIVCILLSVVPEETNLEMFATETNSVLTTLAKLKQFVAEFKVSTNKASFQLARALMDKDVLAEVILSWMLMQLHKGELVDILKVAYIMISMRLSNFDITGATYAVYEKVLNKLNKVEF